MSEGNGHRAVPPVVTATTRPVILARYRPGAAGETARLVHLVPLPRQTPTAGVALCGAVLRPELVEILTPGEGMPCSRCLLSHVRDSPQPPPATAADEAPPHCKGPRSAALTYQRWGWPVTQHRDEVWLALEPEAVALLIPAPLATVVTELLCQRRCPPPVLAHPDTPGHRIVLAGEPYGVCLPWPSDVYRASGTLPLPPTATPHGPITWVHRPRHDALQLCREIDVIAALRTALRDLSG
ncbi:MAG TPA: hypothetical protein VFO16_20320 [Pseudonocardiaceae bacterium]|nr:hypothetical protein [Pseudonocardiaceae bacterium]